MEQTTALPQTEHTEPVRPSLVGSRRFSTVPAADKAAAMVAWLEENKARHVVALDVRGKSACMDVVVVASASSMRHARSLADGLAELCARDNHEFFRTEGYQNGQWILVDGNDVVVHLFQPDTRELFNLEGLWKNAPFLHDGRPAGTVSAADPDPAPDLEES